MGLSNAQLATLPLAHRKPCAECPWRKAHPSGWLGGYEPEHFVASVQHDVPVPCHKTLEHGKKPALCAGALIFMKNGCKLPGTHHLVDARAQVEIDRESVFSFPHEFLAHHRETEDSS